MNRAASTPHAMNNSLDTGAWLRCALHAHTTNSDGELRPAGARQALRAGRLRGARGHRSLVPQRPAFDGPRPRAAERRAELPPGRASATGTCWRFGIDDALASLEGRPARPRGHGAPGSRRTAGSRTWRTRTGPARPPGRSSFPKPSRGSRSTTPAASSRSAGACRRSIGTSFSTRAGCASRSPPTTATTRVRLGSRVDWFAPRRPSRACSLRCAPGASTAPRGPGSRRSPRGKARSRCAVTPAAASRSCSACRAAPRSTQDASGIDTAARSSRRRQTG